jgi:hypothetical protein
MKSKPIPESEIYRHAPVRSWGGSLNLRARSQAEAKAAKKPYFRVYDAIYRTSTGAVVVDNNPSAIDLVLEALAPSEPHTMRS